MNLPQEGPRSGMRPRFIQMIHVPAAAGKNISSAAAEWRKNMKAVSAVPFKREDESINIAGEYAPDVGRIRNI